MRALRAMFILVESSLYSLEVESINVIYILCCHVAPSMYLKIVRNLNFYLTRPKNLESQSSRHEWDEKNKERVSFHRNRQIKLSGKAINIFTPRK
jgi:hypothetical protein